MFTKLPYVSPLSLPFFLSPSPASLIIFNSCRSRSHSRNHLRPFLGRIPQASPDLFTPNPSLLHHLPQQGGSSHGLVAQVQSSTQSTGGSGSAGRAGYQGGSAGSGGGYTVSQPVSTSRERKRKVGED